MLYFQPERMIVVDQLLPLEGDKVLDLGCACGHVSAYLSKTRKVKVVGIDVNAALIDQARQLYGQSASFVVGPGTSLPFRDATFDAVVVLEVLEHVPEDCALISEVSRIVSPGGWVVVSVPNRSWISLIDLNRAKYYFPWLHRALYLLKHRRHLKGFRPELTNHRHYSLAQLSDKLKQHGLAVQSHLYSGGWLYAIAVVASALLPSSSRWDYFRTRWLTDTFRVSLGKQSFNLAVVARKNV